jgi:hypothetical protein
VSIHEHALHGVGGCDGDLDAADAHRDQLGEFQEFEADGSGGGMGQFCSWQGYAPQGGHEHLSERGEPQPQLISEQARRRSPVREEVELAFFDAVLNVAAGAVEFLVKLLCFNVFALERGDDEARIFSLGKVLRLGHDTAFARPAGERLVAQLLEEAFGLAAVLGFDFGLGQSVCDQGFQSLVAGKAENGVDALSLAPRHQVLAGEARIRPKPDVNIRPALPDLGDEADAVQRMDVRRGVGQARHHL